MFKHILFLHPYGHLGVTACVFFSPASSAYANETNEAPIQQVPFGGVEHTHDDEPSLLIEPRAHLRAVVGDTHLENSGLAHGGHDPANSGFSIPGLSLGADFFYGEYLTGFTEGIMSWNDQDGWNAELEELYLSFHHLPGGFELKAGQLFASVGTQNRLHNHAWSFVDANMGNVRFLGDDGLILEGVELNWIVSTHWDDKFTLSFGDTVFREHEEEEEHGEEEHSHSEEAEEALWDTDVLAARYQATFWPRDTCQFIYGASYVQGKNFMSKSARLYGLDFTYVWLQDEDHGKHFTWKNEVMLREVNTEEGKFDEFAFSSIALYKFGPQWGCGLRYDYLEGVDDPELPERHRASTSLTRYFSIDNIESIIRLQYNYDHSEERGNDHSVWLQFGFEWGAGGDAHVH